MNTGRADNTRKDVLSQVSKIDTVEGVKEILENEKQPSVSFLGRLVSSKPSMGRLLEGYLEELDVNAIFPPGQVTTEVGEFASKVDKAVDHLQYLEGKGEQPDLKRKVLQSRDHLFAKKLMSEVEKVNNLSRGEISEDDVKTLIKAFEGKDPRTTLAFYKAMVYGGYINRGLEHPIKLILSLLDGVPKRDWGPLVADMFKLESFSKASERVSEEDREATALILKNYTDDERKQVFEIMDSAGMVGMQGVREGLQIFQAIHDISKNPKNIPTLKSILKTDSTRWGEKNLEIVRRRIENHFPDSVLEE